MSDAALFLESITRAAAMEGIRTALAFAALVGLASYLLIRLVRALPGTTLCDPQRASLKSERTRKFQWRPVPVVGGPALMIGVLFAGSAVSEAGFASLGLVWPGAIASLAALGLAFGVGLVDDLRAGGLSPAAKFAGQCLAGLPIGIGLWLELGSAASPAPLALPWLLILSALAAATALNAINTFDNADGTATGLCGLALGLCSPAAAGALLGFLPFNTLASGRRSRPADNPELCGQSTPSAYLGDSGSHLLGMWILLTPWAWPVLTLPLIDLARLSIERWSRGHPPWRGDRRHLAHLLAERGFKTGAVLCTLAAIAAPSVLLGAAGLRTERWELVLAGLAATGLGYLTCFGLLRRASACGWRLSVRNRRLRGSQ